MTKVVRNPNDRKRLHAFAASRRRVAFHQPYPTHRDVTASETVSRFGIRIPPRPLSLAWGAGHYPPIVLRDIGAASSACEDRRFAVPKGQARIAQRFNAGLD